MENKRSDLFIGICVWHNATSTGKTTPPHYVQEVLMDEKGEVYEVLRDIKMFNKLKDAFNYAQKLGMGYEGTFWQWCRKSEGA